MEDLTKKQKRDILITNYTRALTLLGENATCICDGIEYKYDGKNLIIVDIHLKSKEVVIDPCFDIWSVKDLEHLKNISKLNLGSIRKITTNFMHSLSLEFIIGKNVKTLPDKCFFNCINLKLVDMPNILSIGKECFSECKFLKYLNMPRVVKLNEESIFHTGIKELRLGDVKFQFLTSSICYNFKLRKVIFKSVRELNYSSLKLDAVEYLDLGYFYDSIYNFDFDDKENLIINYDTNYKQLDFDKKLCYTLIENKLLTGKVLKYFINHNYLCRNHELQDFLSSGVKLKELHFKLSDEYKKLGLTNYYNSLFKSYVNKNCIVILDE